MLNTAIDIVRLKLTRCPPWSAEGIAARRWVESKPLENDLKFILETACRLCENSRVDSIRSLTSVCCVHRVHRGACARPNANFEKGNYVVVKGDLKPVTKVFQAG
jgi:hypothetical protein